MLTTFVGVLELGDLVEVRDAWCPEHGRIRPEGLAFPFTAEADVFRAMQADCPICGSRIQLDAEAADERMSQTLVVHTDEAGTRIAVDVLPLRPGAWHLGITSEQPDQPSGAAPARPGDTAAAFFEKAAAWKADYSLYPGLPAGTLAYAGRAPGSF